MKVQKKKMFWIWSFEFHSNLRQTKLWSSTTIFDAWYTPFILISFLWVFDHSKDEWRNWHVPPDHGCTKNAYERWSQYWSGGFFPMRKNLHQHQNSKARRIYNMMGKIVLFPHMANEVYLVLSTFLTFAHDRKNAEAQNTPSAIPSVVIPDNYCWQQLQLFLSWSLETTALAVRSLLLEEKNKNVFILIAHR